MKDGRKRMLVQQFVAKAPLNLSKLTILHRSAAQLVLYRTIAVRMGHLSIFDIAFSVISDANLMVE